MSNQTLAIGTCVFLRRNGVLLQANGRKRLIVGRKTMLVGRKRYLIGRKSILVSRKRYLIGQKPISKFEGVAYI
jgi:hypothetical protein